MELRSRRTIVHGDEGIVAAEEEGLGIGHAEIAVAAEVGEIAGEIADAETAAALADGEIVGIVDEEIVASEIENVGVGSEAVVEPTAGVDALELAAEVFAEASDAAAADIEDMCMASSLGDSLAVWRSHCMATVPAPEEGHCCIATAQARCQAGTGEGCTADTVPS